MNTQVTASNMQVRAVAENGLLINEVAGASDTNWDEEATANQTASNPALLYPASTTNGTTWYHAASKKSNTAAAAGAGAESADIVKASGASSGYETLPALTAITAMSDTAEGGTKAARQTMGRTASDAAGYYVHYQYYLKSSADAITLGTDTGDQNVKIKSVTATLPDAQASEDLNPALRVGIKLNSKFYIYAPVGSYTASYYVAAGSTATSPIAGTTATATDLAQLPAVNAANTTTVDVYIWYEGEDAACKTDNALAATLDNIKIDIVFALETIGA